MVSKQVHLVAELLSKTKYSSIDDLLFAAERIDPDNFVLQISIDDYRTKGSPFDLKAIINALKYYEKLNIT
ncbi:MAG TPA: hypothetical protein EYP22_04715 [Methanosarcinales archaeon]|nr:hypothetical protein [Methanosarcinales archaeon]